MQLSVILTLQGTVMSIYRLCAVNFCCECLFMTMCDGGERLSTARPSVLLSHDTILTDFSVQFNAI